MHDTNRCDNGDTSCFFTFKGPGTPENNTYLHTHSQHDPAPISKALAADGRPIVLASMADNTSGGAAGDGTEILRELLRVGARSATVACIWDAAADRKSTRLNSSH